MKLLQPLSYQQMCKSLPENDNRAPSEPFKNMIGTFTWERRYFSQSFSDGNDLLRGSMDILIWDLGNAIFGKTQMVVTTVLLMVNISSSAILM
jgi:hypothetical protein